MCHMMPLAMHCEQQQIAMVALATEAIMYTYSELRHRQIRGLSRARPILEARLRTSSNRDVCHRKLLQLAASPTATTAPRPTAMEPALQLQVRGRQASPPQQPPAVSLPSSALADRAMVLTERRNAMRPQAWAVMGGLL